MPLSIEMSVFFFRRQCNSVDTTRVPTTPTINYEDASQNTASPTDNHTERTGHFGDKSSETNKDVIDDETINGINKENGDVQLIVPNYRDNAKGLFTRNVNDSKNVHRQIYSMVTSDGVKHDVSNSVCERLLAVLVLIVVRSVYLG